MAKLAEREDRISLALALHEERTHVVEEGDRMAERAVRARQGDTGALDEGGAKVAATCSDIHSASLGACAQQRGDLLPHRLTRASVVIERVEVAAEQRDDVRIGGSRGGRCADL